MSEEFPQKRARLNLSCGTTRRTEAVNCDMYHGYSCGARVQPRERVLANPGWLGGGELSFELSNLHLARQRMGSDREQLPKMNCSRWLAEAYILILGGRPTVVPHEHIIAGPYFS
jgi:hypothetical protein